jgi:DNA-binding NtrC family response regulator
MATNSSRLIILSISRDERLLRTRQMVLESAGWQVVPAMETDEALRRFQEQGFDVVVLGHSIPSSERIWLAQTMKSIRSNVPIVMVCIQGDNTFSTKFADARVGSLDGPVVLINAIRRLTASADKKQHS